MLEKRSKEYIFEWIMGYEDEAMEHMREEVIKTAEFNFGPDGRKVAEYYYKKIDGEDTSDEELDGELDEDCDDCVERAKRLIKVSECIKEFTDILMSDFSTTVLKDVNLDELFEEINLDDMVNKILNKTCFKPSDEQKDILKRRILLEIAIRKDQNGC